MKARALTWLRLVGASALATMLFAACLDTTPITVAPAAQPTDGGLDAPETATSACVACLTSPSDAGPSCATELAGCARYPACQKAFDCVRDQGCFNLGSAAAIENCGIPCAQKAGILTTNGDPAFNAAYAVFTCAAGACGPACVEGDSGP